MTTLAWFLAIYGGRHEIWSPLLRDRQNVTFIIIIIIKPLCNHMHKTTSKHTIQTHKCTCTHKIKLQSKLSNKAFISRETSLKIYYLLHIYIIHIFNTNIKKMENLLNEIIQSAKMQNSNGKWITTRDQPKPVKPKKFKLPKVKKLKEKKRKLD